MTFTDSKGLNTSSDISSFLKLYSVKRCDTLILYWKYVFVNIDFTAKFVQNLKRLFIKIHFCCLIQRKL